jgi:hypothetical protein
MLALRIVSGATADASYLALAGYAFLGPAHAIRALALSWLFTLLNPGIAPEAALGSLGRYAVLFAAAASVMVHSAFGTRQQRARTFTLPTVALGVFIMGHSVLVSEVTDVSVLKAISWTLAMATLLSAWCGLPGWQREELAQQLFWGLALMLLASLPLAALPQGYLVNGTGFQGILSHPQAFGPAMSLLCTWATARLFGEARPPWWLLAVAGTALAAILLSEARTAALAAAAGVAFSVLIGPSFAGQSIIRMAPGLKSARVWIVMMGLGLAGLALAPLIADLVWRFISKRTEVGDLMEAYDRSRGGLIDAMLANIAEHPLTGIGFGIASEPWTMVVKHDPLLGLPIGASIEKGVVFLMVLEELGIFGAVLVAAWLLGLLRGSARSGLVPFALCVTALLLNMGEATLFSPGGFGLLPLILLGWAYASGTPVVKRRYG